MRRAALRAGSPRDGGGKMPRAKSRACVCLGELEYEIVGYSGSHTRVPWLISDVQDGLSRNVFHNVLASLKTCRIRRGL